MANLAHRKFYPLQRMRRAVERAIEATTLAEKEQATRWAEAWGAFAGIVGNGKQSHANQTDKSIGSNLNSECGKQKKAP